MCLYGRAMLDSTVCQKAQKAFLSATLRSVLGLLISSVVLGSCAPALPISTQPAVDKVIQGQSASLDQVGADVVEIETKTEPRRNSLPKIRAECLEKDKLGESMPFEPSFYSTLRSMLAEAVSTQKSDSDQPEVTQFAAHKNALNAIAEWVETVTGDRKKLDDAWVEVLAGTKEKRLNHQLVEFLMLFGVDSAHHDCEAWLTTLAFTGYVQSFVPGATFEKDSDPVEEGYDYVTKEIPKSKEKVRIKIPREP